MLKPCDVNLTTGDCFYYVKNQTLHLLAQPEPVGAQKFIDNNVSPSSKHKASPTVATRYGLAYFIYGKPWYPPKGTPLEKVDIDPPCLLQGGLIQMMVLFMCGGKVKK